jgi:hypothetical protein
VLKARNDALIDKVQRKPDNYTLIEATIANGYASVLVMTLATGRFWDSDTGINVTLYGQGEDTDGDYDDANIEDDGEDDANVDEVDVMMTRMLLDKFAKSMGDPGFPLPGDDELE